MKMMRARCVPCFSHNKTKKQLLFDRFVAMIHHFRKSQYIYKSFWNCSRIIPNLLFNVLISLHFFFRQMSLLFSTYHHKNATHLLPLIIDFIIQALSVHRLETFIAHKLYQPNKIGFCFYFFPFLKSMTLIWRGKISNLKKKNQ